MVNKKNEAHLSKIKKEALKIDLTIKVNIVYPRFT